jgi:hypothetical protein
LFTLFTLSSFQLLLGSLLLGLFLGSSLLVNLEEHWIGLDVGIKLLLVKLRLKRVLWSIVSL